MGSKLSNAMNKSFQHHTPGMAGPGETGGGSNPKIPPPVVPKFNQPQFYAPKQSQLQRVTYDPASTSHNYLQRFGIPKHD